ncbi:ABC transporter permease [Asticcacaulis sp. W401b]|uniref:ABC transporter permease n=1 Tax=Asticcacaulis sp. W401b TaxID=3388666 RepID=UPI003970F9D0
MKKNKLSVSPRLWSGYADVVAGFKDWKLWLALGYQDVRQRYVRSMLGPLWMVMGLGVTILGIGLLYGQIFRTDSGEFIPFIAASLAAWNFISTALSEATTIFQTHASLLKSISVPYSSVILRNIVKNVIVFLHYLVAVAVTFMFCGFPVDYTLIFVVPGLVIVCANLYWLSLLIGMICARFRDMAQIVLYGIQVTLFITPIIWMPSQVRAGSPFVHYNPAHHLIELIRAPLFEHRVPLDSYFFCSVMLLFGTVITLLSFNKFKRYINFWI